MRIRRYFPTFLGGFRGALDSYTGDMEVSWSFRRMFSSYNDELIIARRSSDGDEEGFYGSGDDGFINLSIFTAWRGGANAYLVRFSDQTGQGRHIVQTAAASQPLIVLSATPEGRPTARFDGVDDFLQVDFATGTIKHVFMLFRQNTWTGNDTIFEGAGGGGGALIQTPSTPNVRMITGVNGNSKSVPLGTFYQTTCYFNNVDTTYIRVDQSETVNASNIGAGSSGFTLGANVAGSENSDTEISEFIDYSAKVAPADQSAIELNMIAAYK